MSSIGNAPAFPAGLPVRCILGTWQNGAHATPADAATTVSDSHPVGGAATVYCFRIRFLLGPHVRIDADVPEITLNNAAGPGEVILKSPVDGEMVKQATTLVLLGRGYGTENQARTHAARWRDALEPAFARLLIGADFGDRAAKGKFTDAGLQWLEAQHGRRVLNDEHGTMVYECEPRPFFASSSLEYFVGKPTHRLVEVVEAALAARVSPTPQQRLAYDLFSSSFFQTSADARFITLMMALETLLELRPRDAAARTHVYKLIRLTRASGLEQRDVDSMVGSLQWLRNESISQAGRRVASSLGDRTYMDGTEDPARFFDRCYAVRSQLLHGAVPRPSRDDVNKRAASLERFVGDLLSGPLLTVVPD